MFLPGRGSIPPGRGCDMTSGRTPAPPRGRHWSHTPARGAPWAGTDESSEDCYFSRKECFVVIHISTLSRMRTFQRACMRGCMPWCVRECAHTTAYIYIYLFIYFIYIMYLYIYNCILAKHYDRENFHMTFYDHNYPELPQRVAALTRRPRRCQGNQC